MLLNQLLHRLERSQEQDERDHAAVNQQRNEARFGLISVVHAAQRFQLDRLGSHLQRRQLRRVDRFLNIADKSDDPLLLKLRREQVV